MRLASAAAALAASALLAGCGGTALDSGGLSASDRRSAQAAMDALHGSNVALQLIAITKTLESTPAACRMHVASREAGLYKVYVFWIPWLGSEPYTWLDMTLANDRSRDVVRLGTAKPVLPGGRLSPDGHSVDPWSQDTTLLSRYGPAQDRKNQQALRAHAGTAFAKPGAACQVLMNGDLRLVPNR